MVRRRLGTWARDSPRRVCGLCVHLKRKEDCGCQFSFRLARSVSCVGGLAKYLVGRERERERGGFRTRVPPWKLING